MRTNVLAFCLTCIVAVGGLWLVLDRVLLRRVSVTWSARQLLWNNPTVSYLLDTSYYHRRTAADRLNCSAYDDKDRCQHGGLLEPTDDGFRCKCTPDYDGEKCANEKTLKLDITWPKIPWNLFKFGADLQEVYTSHQNRVEDFNEKMFSDGSGSRKGLRGSNLMTSARILPSSRPLQCPTDKNLPPLEMLYDQVFRPKLAAAAKKHDRNVLHQIFYQYFVLQYFNTDFELKVSASQLYGADQATKTALRSFSNGKLKTDVSNGQHYPPSMSSVEWFKTVYPPTKRNLNPQWFNRIKSESSGTFSSKFSNLLGPSKRKRHAGHPMLNENPILDAMSTLWVREHNRVCDLLTRQWPSWADQEIYDTARKIVIGEMMVITMNEILSVKFKPELFRDRIRNVQSSNTPFELLLISNMWPSGLPSRFENATLFDPNSGVFENGIDDDTTSAKTAEPMTRLMLTLSREKAVQSLNSYRRHAGLPAYRGFTELTGGDAETAERLRSVYEDDVERVELLPGIAAERKRKGRSPTAAALTEAFVVNSILTHPLASSNESWSPVTFGGDAGFHAVQSATLESLICNNLSTDTDCATLRQLLSSDHRVRFARDVFAYAAACLVPVTIFGFKYAVSRRRRLVPGGSGGGGEDQWRIRTGDRPSHPFAYRVLAAILAALPKVFIVFLHVSDPRNAFRLYRKLYRSIFRTVLGLGPLLPKLLLCCSFAVSVAITTAYVLFFYKLYVYKLSHPYTDISPVFTDNIVSYIVLTVSVICMGNHFYLLFI